MNTQLLSMSKDYVHAAHAAILLAGAHLSDGETVRDFLCPFCNGGPSKEKAFALTREGHVFKYYCHRASCGESGRVGKNGAFIDETRQAYSSQALAGKPRVFRNPLMTVPVIRLQFLINKYGFKIEDIRKAGIMWDPGTQKYAVPSRGPHGTHRGYMMRSPHTTPKWDAWQEDVGEPWTSWYAPYMQDIVNKEKRPVVIVEDQFSAIKISRQYVSCALHGTDIGYVKAIELLEIGGPWVLALDSDAYNKSINHLHTWRFYFGEDVRVVKLAQDLKYESDKNIKAIVQGAV